MDGGPGSSSTRTEEVLHDRPVRGAGLPFAEHQEVGGRLGQGEEGAVLVKVEGRVGGVGGLLAGDQGVRRLLHVDDGLRPVRPRLVVDGLVERDRVPEIEVLTAEVRGIRILAHCDETTEETKTSAMPKGDDGTWAVLDWTGLD